MFAGGPIEKLLGSSINYRIAVGPQQGLKVFTLQTLPACDEPFEDEVGKVAGFSLHAGVAARADERNKLERLCRYISRPAIAEKRLSLRPNGNVRYHLVGEPLATVDSGAVTPPRGDWRVAATADRGADTDEERLPAAIKGGLY